MVTPRSTVYEPGAIIAQLVAADRTAEDVRLFSRQGSLFGEMRFPGDDGTIDLLVRDGCPDLYPGLRASVEYDDLDGHYRFETQVIGVASWGVRVARPALIQRDGRRRTLRIALAKDSGASVTLGGHACGGPYPIHDLSLGGLSFEEEAIDVPLDIGDKAPAVLCLLHEGVIEVDIEIRHVEAFGIEHRLGARFMSMTARDRSALARFLVHSC